MTTSLTPELLDLMEHEKVIEQGLASFVEVGNALLAIRDGKRYRAAGFTSFETYLRERWDMSRPRGYQLLDAAKMVAEMSTNVDTPLPSSEGQTRALARLPESERADAWAEAVERANGDTPTGELVAEVVKERRTPKPVPKKRVADDVPPHPATYPKAVMDRFRELLADLRATTVLDPFAGVGTIHELRPDFETTGVEIEEEWARARPETKVGDSRHLRRLFRTKRFDAIVTSPAYGNRLADSYEASDPEARRSYAIDLGHPLDEHNGAGMHFQRDGRYEELHREVWAACLDVLVPGGYFILNCKDFKRDGAVVPVTAWHIHTLMDLGFKFVDLRTLEVGGLAMASAAKLSELIVVLAAPRRRNSA